MSLFKILKGDSSRISTDVTPFHDGWAYFTPDDDGFYIDSQDGDEQNRHRINIPVHSEIVTLVASGWSSGTQTVNVPGLGASQDGVAGMPQDATEEEIHAAGEAEIRVTGQGAGTLTFTAEGTIPETDIRVFVVMM